jgi:hypothetical protein
MIWQDEVTVLGHGSRPFNFILKFSHIAGEIIQEEKIDSLT